MRYLLIGLVIAFVTQLAVAFGQATPSTAPVWNTSLPLALQQAQATQRPVLAVFSGSDWCKPCMMLKQEVFDQPEFARFAQDKLVLARFDFPRNKKNKLPADQTTLNEQAASQLNTAGEFPLVVVLSPEGKILARTGYRAGGAAAYTAYLQPYLTSK
jgi:uncharacterized protein YyaL (SSP411 family)